jgi:protein-glutamine gamma-glutamyltransferase
MAWLPSSTAPTQPTKTASTPWRQRFRPPAVEPEHSGLLRALVQLMVLVGIVANDVAAGSQMSLWAVPLSIAGATWSWFNRRKPNTGVKFLLALGMLAALVAFFLGLRGELNDTRMALAELLVQLQVLHTFDLPRRKDLGYSMVIGLILIGVASTLSQTMVFGGFLLVFLALSLPVLGMDYRARLGLAARPQRLVQSGFSLRRLGAFWLGILSLGLVIFLSLPRLPGYQLRTFPVSQAINVQSSFDSRQIINPGYVRPGNATGQRAGGGSAGQGAASGGEKFDENQYYGFGQRMNQNLRGELKPKLVMRVRSQLEGFWRVMAFDRYTGQGWEVSRNEQVQKIGRSQWSYQFFIPAGVTLNRTREVIQTYTVVADLPNLIPTLLHPRELFFPTQEVAVDSDTGLRSPVPLADGVTYTVISDVPYRDRTKLGASGRNYLPGITQHYLNLPSGLKPKLKAEAERLLARSEKPLTNPYEISLYLTQALKQQFKVLPDMPVLAPGEDLAEAFLFKYQGGYPDHFSTSLALLLRSLDIPTRLGAGYAPGQFNPFTGLYQVRNTDAYSLVEVYFAKHGWFAFDPIPGHPLYPPTVEDHQTFSALQQFWKWVASWLPSPLTNGLSAVFGGLLAALARWLGWLVGLFTQGWLGMLVGTAILIALAFGGWLMWQLLRRWRYGRWLRRLEPTEQLYQQMLRWLGDRHHPKRPSETPLEYAARVEVKMPQQAAVIWAIAQAYGAWRYGRGADQRAGAADVTALKQQWQAATRS